MMNGWRISEKYRGCVQSSPCSAHSFGVDRSKSSTTPTASRFSAGFARPRTAISLRHSQDAATRGSNDASHSRPKTYSTNTARLSLATASASTTRASLDALDPPAETETSTTGTSSLSLEARRSASIDGTIDGTHITKERVHASFGDARDLRRGGAP